MSVITPEWYNDFDKTYINQSYIPETFCVGSVDQYIYIMLLLQEMSDNVCDQNKTITPVSFQ